MTEIVNVSRTWGIGRNGDLLIYIPDDMKHFREVTRGAVVIMGSTTLESFPNMAPLKNRINIVLIDDDKKIRPRSVEAARKAKEAGEKTELIYVHSKEEAVALGRQYEAEGQKVFVIGGATIYRILLDDCDECSVTINDCPLEADTYYPDLSKKAEWQMVESGEEQEYEGTHFHFTRWIRK